MFEIGGEREDIGEGEGGEVEESKWGQIGNEEWIGKVYKIKCINPLTIINIIKKKHRTITNTGIANKKTNKTGIEISLVIIRK